MLRVVYLRSGGMLLTKKEYATWMEIQNEYDEYMASLGPWDEDAVIDFIRTEYPTDPPFAAEQVRQFVVSGDIVLVSA